MTMQPRQQPDVFDLRTSIAHNFRRVGIILDRLESGEESNPGLGRAKIEAVSEIRHNIALAQKAIETINLAEASRRFEEYIIELLARESPRARKQLIGKLNEIRDKRGNGPAAKSDRP